MRIRFLSFERTGEEKSKATILDDQGNRNCPILFQQYSLFCISNFAG